MPFVLFLLGIASLLILWGTLWLYRLLMRHGIAWFLACIAIPPVGIILYSIFHYQTVKKPLAITILGFALLALAQFIDPDALSRIHPPM